MKLNSNAYNPEIAHCAGARQYACKDCLRNALFETWRAMPAGQAESIILMSPQADQSGCPCRIRMPRGYVRSRCCPAQVEFTGRSCGRAV